MGLCAKPEKPKPSAQDIALADAALADQAFFESVFLPEEREQIRQAKDPVLAAAEQSILSGSAAADVAQAGAANRLAAGTMAGMKGSSEPITATGRVFSAADAGAGASARRTGLDVRDTRTLAAAQTGLGLQQSTTSGLVRAARRGENEGLNRLERDLLKKNALLSAVGSVVGASVAVGADRLARPQTPGELPTNSPLATTPQFRDPYPVRGLNEVHA